MALQYLQVVSVMHCYREEPRLSRVQKGSFLRLFPFHLSITFSYVWSDRMRVFLLPLSLNTLSDGKLSCSIFS